MQTNEEADDLFEDDDLTTDNDAFGEDVVILSADNKEELLAPTERRFLFPAEPGTKRAGFYVRHASLARVQRYQNAHKSGNVNQQLRAACELIADSVVDESGRQVWTADQIKSMANGRIDRFLFMQQCVSLHNGMSDSSDKMREIIEEAGKN